MGNAGAKEAERPTEGSTSRSKEPSPLPPRPFVQTGNLPERRGSSSAQPSDLIGWESDSDTETEAMLQEACKYWDKCYRKSESHFRKFLHPCDFGESIASQNLNNRPSTSTPSAVDGASASTSSGGLEVAQECIPVAPQSSVTCPSTQVTDSSLNGTTCNIIPDGETTEYGLAEDGERLHSDDEESVVSSVAESIAESLPGQTKIRDGLSVHVENLPPFVKRKTVRLFFEKAGFRPTKRINLVRRGKQVACKITFESEELAQKAAKTLVGQNLDGKKIRVRYLPKTEASDGGIVDQQATIKQRRNLTNPSEAQLTITYTGKVTFVSPTRIFIECTKDLLGEPPRKRTVYYPPDFYPKTLLPLIPNDKVSFTLGRKRETNKKESDKPPARNLKVLMYANREKELIESYVSSLVERVCNGDQSDVTALATSLPTWTLLGCSLSKISMDCLVELLSVVRKLVTSENNFVNGVCFSAFAGYKFLHLGNALHTFLKDMLDRNRPFELQIILSFLTSVAANANDAFVPQFICQMSICLGAKSFYRESISLMDVMRKNKQIKVKEKLVLPSYEELTIIPMDRDPEIPIRLQSYVSVEDYLEAVSALLKLDLFSRISSALVAELHNLKKKTTAAVVLKDVVIAQMKLSSAGACQFVIETSSKEDVSVGSLFAMSQEDDFRNLVFGCVVRKNNSSVNQYDVEIFPESLENIDVTLFFLPKTSAKMLVVPTVASKCQFLRALETMSQEEKKWRKSEVLRVLSEPSTIGLERLRIHKQTVAKLREHAAAGKCFTMAGLELIPRESDILAMILESRISAVQIHPGADVSDLLFMMLYIIAQEAASGPILYLTKGSSNRVVITAAISRVLGEDAIVLEGTLLPQDNKVDKTAELFVKTLEKEVAEMLAVVQSNSGDLHAVFEKLFIEDIVRRSDKNRLINFIRSTNPEIQLSDIQSFLEICNSEGLLAAQGKIKDCEKLIQVIGDYQTSDPTEAVHYSSPGEYLKYFDSSPMKVEYTEAEHQLASSNDTWGAVIDLAIGQLATGKNNSELMYSQTSRKIVQSAGETFKNLLGRQAEIRDEVLSECADKLSKKRLIVVFDDEFSSVFEVISRLSPSMIVVNNASHWAEWELLPLLKPSVKQTILLGDVNILNPSVENLHLAKLLNYSPSLFEHVYRNQSPAIRERLTIFEQDVARPEMFLLVSDVYIPSVLTGKKKKQYFPSGLVQSLFFWTHTDPDNAHQKSWINHGEATRVVTIANYLVENGTSPTDIIIVSPFIGQVIHLRQKLKKMKLNIDVFLIENFLAERSNTVLVSLVKTSGDIGIIEDVKRRCSLMTRANSAMIIFGNAELLSKSNVWQPVISIATDYKCLSNEIPLCCPVHRKTKKNFKVPTEINTALTKPFCTESCPHKFPCRHTCNRACRPEHTHTTCTAVEEVQHPVCKHRVARLCNQNIKDVKCQFTMDVTFRCGHQGILKCGQKMECQVECRKLLPCKQHFCKKKCEPVHDHLVCNEDVPIVHPQCGHDTFRKCSQSIVESVCLVKIEQFLIGCGHMSERFCYQKKSDVSCSSKCYEPTQCYLHPRCELPCATVIPHNHSVCGGEVEVVLPDCGHESKRLCSQPESVVVCRKEIDMVFKYCKHTQKVLCWERNKMIACKEQCQEFICKRHRCPLSCEPPHDHPKKCIEEVPFTYPNCKHPGVKPCYMPDRDAASIPCETLVLTAMSCKTHTLPKKCFEARSSLVCTEACGSVLKCGHACSRPCQPSHDHSLCMEKVKLRQACGIHSIDVLCGFRPELKCNEEVARQLACGHNVTIKCHQRGEIISCQITKKRKFPCGHEKTISCSEWSSVTICLGYPCQKTLPCGHLCSKKCGETCDETGCPKCRSDMQRQEKLKEDAERNRKRLAIEEARKSVDKLKFSASYIKTELERNSAEFISVEDKVTKYIQVSHNWYPTVIKIEKVANDRLRKAYLECQQDLFNPCYSDLKFHGTDSGTIEKICKYGFRIPPEDGKKRMYGRGIYFATDSSKSAQNIYTRGSDMLLLCEVLIGNSYTALAADNTMSKERLRLHEFDSLYAKRGTTGIGGVRYDEFVIYDERQAFPTYVIHYRTGAMNMARLHPLLSSGGGVRKHNLYPKRTFDPSSEEDQHYRIAESQFLRLQQERQTYQQYKLKQVTWVENPALYNRFNSKQKEFESRYGLTTLSKPILAFHGTPRSENLDLIVEKNFDNTKIARTAYGFGHYFSEFPDVSFGYASGVKKLLLCQLLPGRSYDVGANYNIPSGYDSNRVGKDPSGRGQMIIIANVDQILPCYILHFE